MLGAVKRVKLGPEFQPEKHGVANYSVDGLSGLPDDVLVIILSSLPLREAARTSVLSSRWTNLWRHSLCLNFDADDALCKIAKHPELGTVERRKYVNWVNSVLRSHKAPMVDEVRICFDLDKSCRKAITLWLEFAFARQVQRLELSLLNYNYSRRSSNYKYDLRAEFLGRGTRKAPLLKHPPTLFKSLKSLCLRAVNVSGEDIDFFLRNCPFLEQLIVQGSRVIPEVEVCGSSLKLKHFEISDCCPINPSIKISAPNLTSLKLNTLSGLLLEDVPMLVELNLKFSSLNLYKHKYVLALHCCISRLEMLTLYLTEIQGDEVPELPQMPNLKKLKARYYPSSHEGLIMYLISFIRAAPHLQELEVKIMDKYISGHREVGDGIMLFPHQHLKVLKLSGCCAGASEIEFVRNIWANCVALEKIIIDPRYQQPFPSRPRTPEDIVMERSARNYVKQHLEQHVPNHIQLLILEL